VYGFNHCVPINLIPIPVNEKTSMDKVKKAEMMKKLHEQFQSHIEEKITKYAKHANKGKKMVRLEPGDLVWIRLSKGIFPSK
jgi:translation initiation factor IF-1